MSEIDRFLPTRDVRIARLSFEQVDSIPYVDELDRVICHQRVERLEQLLAKKLIRPSDAVLELGGRYGTVSAVINNILDAPERHVVIEPDYRVIPALLRNRDTHNAFFTVYRNIICARPKRLVCDCYSTRVVDTTEVLGKFLGGSVPSMTLRDVLGFHGFSFSVLFADCEGCMEEFVRDNLAFVAGLRLVVYEQDFSDLSNYERVAEMLAGMGFRRIVDGFHTAWAK